MDQALIEQLVRLRFALEHLADRQRETTAAILAQSAVSDGGDRETYRYFENFHKYLRVDS